MKYISAIPLIIILALIGWVCYTVYGIGREKPKPGQVWVYYPENDDPFYRFENDTMQVIAIGQGYVQYNGSRNSSFNPQSSRVSSFLLRAERIK